MQFWEGQPRLFRALGPQTLGSLSEESYSVFQTLYSREWQTPNSDHVAVGAQVLVFLLHPEDMSSAGSQSADNMPAKVFTV